VLTLLLVPVMFMWLGPKPKTKRDVVLRDLRMLTEAGAGAGVS
jgi:hypothetical protein